MELIDGKKIAAQVKQELADEVKRMKAAGAKTPHLVAVLVGNDPASETYVASKVKACQEVGFKSTEMRYSADITEEQLLAVVDKLNQDADVDGYIVQLPLPRLTLEPFSIHHDAANPVAYRVSHERKSVAVATDMGHYDQYVIDHLKDLDALLLEANHDVNMLETGPYPYYLKRRILGDHGHLSNENAGRLLNYILNDKLKYVLLGHLSKENNYEALAYETVRFEIDQGDTPYKAKDFPIEVAKRDEMSQIIHL